MKMGPGPEDSEGKEHDDEAAPAEAPHHFVEGSGECVVFFPEGERVGGGADAVDPAHLVKQREAKRRRRSPAGGAARESARRFDPGRRGPQGKPGQRQSRLKRRQPWCGERRTESRPLVLRVGDLWGQENDSRGRIPGRASLRRLRSIPNAVCPWYCKFEIGDGKGYPR
jgi:hypothetical protein